MSVSTSRGNRRSRSCHSKEDVANLLQRVAVTDGLTSDRARRACWPLFLKTFQRRHLSKTERKRSRRASTSASCATTITDGEYTACASPPVARSKLEPDGESQQHQQHAARYVEDPFHSQLPDADPSSSLSPVQPYPKNCCLSVVEADVPRSLWHLVKDPALRETRRSQLREILLRCTLADPSIHYYQGLHDIVSIVLVVCFSPTTSVEDSERSSRRSTKNAKRKEQKQNHHRRRRPSVLASEITEELPKKTTDDDEDGQMDEKMKAALDVSYGLCLHRLKRFCASSMSETEPLLVALHGIVQEANPRLARLLEAQGHGPSSFYALSWMITWFAHDVEHLPTICRVFDFLIATDENMIVFLCAALVLHFEDDLIQAAETDPGMLFVTLTHLPRNIVTDSSSKLQDPPPPSEDDDEGSLREDESPIIRELCRCALQLEQVYKRRVLSIVKDPSQVVPLPLQEEENRSEASSQNEEGAANSKSAVAKSHWEELTSEDGDSPSSSSSSTAQGHQGGGRMLALTMTGIAAALYIASNALSVLPDTAAQQGGA